MTIIYAIDNHKTSDIRAGDYLEHTAADTSRHNQHELYRVLSSDKRTVVVIDKNGGESPCIDIAWRLWRVLDKDTNVHPVIKFEPTTNAESTALHHELLNLGYRQRDGERRVIPSARNFTILDHRVIFYSIYNDPLEFDTEGRLLEPTENVTTFFKDMKFKVESEEHYLQVRDYLFSLGYNWKSSGFGNNGGFVGGDHPSYLYTNTIGQLTYGIKENFFNTSPKKEFFIRPTSYELVPIIKTIELFGETYDEDAVREAVKQLKQIESVK